MKILVISGSPKKEGLCQSVTDEILRGINDAGAEAQEIRMDGIERCRVCGDGWGACLESRQCPFGDDGFDEAHKAVSDADALVMISPVYWGETTEGLKSFMDRLRRCSFAPNRDASDKAGVMTNKPVLLVASPGGSGNGAVTCLGQMERFCQHMGAKVFDFVSVNRWNGEYKRKAAYAAVFAMASGTQIPERKKIS